MTAYRNTTFMIGIWRIFDVYIMIYRGKRELRHKYVSTPFLGLIILRRNRPSQRRMIREFLWRVLNVGGQT